MNWNWLFSTIILGSIVLFCYIYFLPKCPSKRLWAGISNPSVQWTYIFSIGLSFLAYLILWIYYLHSSESILLPLGNYIFLIGAILWPVFLYYLPSTTLWIGTALSITSLGALLLLIGTCMSGSEFHAGILLCAIYLFLHVFCFDNVYWLFSYQKNILTH